MDNLNTHTKASQYQTFLPEEIFELAKRLEIDYTPKHGSWLNIAEIKLNVMLQQCLKCRISDIKILSHQLSTWEQERNSNKATIQWQFKTEDIRIKLISLFPKFV